MLFKLVWRNLGRNINRTLITMASVFFAVLLSISIESLQTGVFENLINNVVGYYSSYVQVHAKGYFEEQTLDNVLEHDGALLRNIESHENVASASQRVEIFVLASGNLYTRGCMVTGINPEKEKTLIKLHQKVASGSYLTATDQSVLLGDELAKKLGLKLNDTIVLLGQGYHGVTAAGKYTVKGLLHFGAPELNNSVLFMPIATCRTFLGMEQQATTIAIALKNPKRLAQTATELRALCGDEREVIIWEEMMPEVVEHMKTEKASGWIASFMLYVLVSFGIFSTLLMMMAERKFEFGMLLAIGMKKAQLARVMVLESLLVTIAGSLCGVAVSIPLVWYLKVHPIRFSGEFARVYEIYGFEAIFPTSTDPQIFVRQTALIVTISLLLSLYSVIKIFALNPVIAMKR